MLCEKMQQRVYQNKYLWYVNYVESQQNTIRYLCHIVFLSAEFFVIFWILRYGFAQCIYTFTMQGRDNLIGKDNSNHLLHNSWLINHLDVEDGWF